MTALCDSGVQLALLERVLPGAAASLDGMRWGVAALLASADVEVRGLPRGVGCGDKGLRGLWRRCCNSFICCSSRIRRELRPHLAHVINKALAETGTSVSGGGGTVKTDSEFRGTGKACSRECPAGAGAAVWHRGLPTVCSREALEQPASEH